MKIFIIILIVVAVGGFGFYQINRTSDVRQEESIQDQNLPPDPGEAGKVTIEGIDTDGDGVRDDVQRYIALTYPDSEKKRAALTQSAKALQAFLLDASNMEKTIEHSEENSAAGACIRYVFKSDFDVLVDIRKNFHPTIVNTPIREEAFRVGNEHLKNRESRLLTTENELRAACNFDPDKMKN